MEGSVPVDGNGGSDFYDIRKGTNGLIPLYAGKVRIQYGRDKRVPPFTDRLRKDYGQGTDKIRIQHGRDTDKQYGLATDILRAAFARMPLFVCIAGHRCSMIYTVRLV